VSSAPAPPAKPRLWTVAVAFLAAVGGSLRAGGIVGVAILFAMGFPASPRDVTELQHRVTRLATTPGFILGSVLLNSFAFGLTALVAAWLSPQPLPERLRAGRARVGTARVLTMLVLLLAVGQVLGSALVLSGWEGQGVLGGLARALANPTAATLVGAIVVIGLLAGIGEELFFRGYMQTRLRERWGAWPAILVTAVLFGLIHMDPWHTPVATGIGVTLGWITELSGSLRPAVLAHVVNNVLSVVFLGFGVEVSYRGHLVVLPLAVATTLACILALRRPTGSHPPGSSDAPIVPGSD
jgi:membrane protease YdiL (CAAX protease family)